MASARQIIPTTKIFNTEDDTVANLLKSLNNYEKEFKELFEEEKSNLHIDDSVKNDIKLNSSEIQRLTHDVISDLNTKELIQTVDLGKVIDIGDKTGGSEQFLKTLDVVCEDCVKYENVSSAIQVTPGDHIRFHRLFGQINLYNHHAIVTRVETAPSTEQVGDVTLVHFQKTINSEISVIRETKTLNFGEGLIDIIRYPTSLYTRKEIIERANKMADRFEQKKQQDSYWLPSNNCEDKSNEIATGLKFSNQFKKLSAYIKSIIAWVLRFSFRIAVMICDKLKPVIRGFAPTAVIASLISIVDQIASLYSKKSQGILCLECFDRECNKLLASLVFSLITLGISVMFHVSFLYIGISTALVVAVPFVSSLLIDTIMPIIRPAANIPKHVVKRCAMVNEGDVITFPYIGLYHEGVVAKKTVCHEINENVVKVTVVHFNYPGLFTTTRTVVKEDFYFDLKKKNISVYDFSKEHAFPAEEVVQRAIDKIGSQDFHFYSFRSSHLSRYCKTGKNSTENLPYKRAEAFEDIRPGDVINFTYCWLSHDAVVIQVQYPESFKCDVIHYNYPGLTGTRTVVQEEFSFDLKDQNVFVHDYSNEDIYEPKEVVNRAISRLGEQKFNTFTNRSSHLVKWCKVKEKQHQD